MSHSPDQLSWYLAQYKPNSAKIAQRNLNRQGFRTFLPMEPITRRKGARFVDGQGPVFPGYIFIAVPIGMGPWTTINSTLGVSRLVCLGPHPTSVPALLIEQLFARYDVSGNRADQGALRVGDDVSFHAGPFTDFVGSIESIDAEKRIWVLMDLMGAKVKVAIKTDHVRAFQPSK